MTPMRPLRIRNVEIGNHLPLTLIAGPCQLESREHAFMMAGELKEIARRLGIGLIYKTSFDKANRTSLLGKRGAGLETASYIGTDDTGARHQGRNGYCTVIGNDWFACFESTDSKSRLNFLHVLHGRQRHYGTVWIHAVKLIAQESPCGKRQRQPNK